MTDETRTNPDPGQAATAVTPPLAGAAAPSTAAELAESTSPLLGSDPRTRAASRAVRAIVHAAASFVLYDAANEAVHRFLAEMQDAVSSTLAAHGTLEVNVHPWEITSAGEVVFVDRDRERSLPFRLYRDGVRTLAIEPGVTWDELVELLGILAARSKGIQQHEDDVVTLLWRADFSHIRVRAVETLVADDDEDEERRFSEANGPRTALQALAWSAPYSFDIPPPPFTERAVPAWRAIPAPLLGRIHREDGPGELPAQCRQLVAELVAFVGDPVDPLTVSDLAPLLREIRAALAAEDAFEDVAAIARLLTDPARPETQSRKELLAAFVDAATLRTLFTRATADPSTRPAFVELLLALPGDHLPMLLAVAGDRAAPETRGFALDLVETLARVASGSLASALRDTARDPDPALLQVLERADPEAAVAVAAELVARGNASVQLAAMGILERATYGPRVGRALVAALAAPAEGTRRRALAALVAHRERRAVDALLERLAHPSPDGLADAEATAIGEALAALDPERVAPVFRDWIKPPGFLGRLAPVAPCFRWAAIGGIACLPPDEAAALLRWLEPKVSGDLQRACTAAIATVTGGAR